MKQLQLKNQGISFYFGCAVVLLAWVSAVAYIALDVGDITFSWIAVALLAVGGGLILASLLIKQGLFLLAGSLCCSAALGELLRVGLPSVSDIWNGVTFIGGNGQLAVVFIAVLAVVALLACVLCFLPRAAQ